jgi:hypothetical protein
MLLRPRRIMLWASAIPVAHVSNISGWNLLDRLRGFDSYTRIDIRTLSALYCGVGTRAKGLSDQCSSLGMLSIGTSLRIWKTTS